MERERILSLLEMLKNSAALELSVREGDRYVRLRRASMPASAAAAEPTVEVSAASPAAGGMAVAGGAVEVTARLVGLFHRGQTPEGPPLVEVGDQVRKGQTVATIESLRQMTSVTAPVGGTISAVLAEENEPVQFGQVLLILEPGPEE